MEILKRAKSKTDGEVVSCFESESNVKEEVDRRTWKAGYTTRHGEPLCREKISSGWSRQFEENFKRIRKE